MGEIDFTTVLAVDARTVEQLETVWPTWRTHKPDLFQHPLRIVCDLKTAGAKEGEADIWWRKRLMFASADHPDCDCFFWRWDAPEATQRERMLTSHVYAAELAETPYILKLDTDAIATRPGPWIDAEWFDGEPAMVGNRWPYTKPGRWVDHLRAWAADHPALQDRKPLDWPLHDPANELYRRPRWVSWCAFIRTDFARQAVEFAGDRLPVPSHDTYLWFLAEWMRERIKYVRMKKRGWDNRTTKRGRAALVVEVMK